MELQSRSKSIGGYLSLQLNEGQDYYPNLIPLNTGRNALEYILRIKKYHTIYIPYFTCDVILEPIIRLNVNYKFYHLDDNFNPIIDFILDDYSCLLYTNYFGIKTDIVEILSKKVKNLIIDNAQAFFNKPTLNCDTFYSCRKFFGVPDGAYLKINSDKTLELESDESIYRFSHLIKSIDQDIEFGYSDFIENNRLLENNAIMMMSQLTKSILRNVNYDECITTRKQNFNFLDENLKHINLLPFNYLPSDVPMVYPLLLDNKNLKESLIKKKIFIATYWPNVINWTETDSYEYFLAENLVAIPIDHRYNLNDMKLMISIIHSLL